MPATGVITKRMADAAKYTGTNGSRCVLWDTKVTGFGLRVFPSGKKSWIISYRPKGSTAKRMMALGQYGVLTVARAREMATEKLSAAAKGDDPLEKKEKERTAETVAELCELYLERELKHKKSRAAIQRRINRSVSPVLGRKKVVAVTPEDVARLFYRIGDTSPVEANRTLSLLRRLFNLARAWGIVERGHFNPTTDLKAFPEKSRERTASEDELRYLWDAIRADDDLYPRTAVELILFTGCRRWEVLKLRWRDVDFTANVLRLPDTKANKPAVVPLSGPAVEALKQLPRGVGDTPLFPHPYIKRAWNRIRSRFWLAMHPEVHDQLRTQAVADVQRRGRRQPKDEAAIQRRILQLVKIPEEDRLTLHDLRRTVGSQMALHIAPTVVGKALRNPSAVAVYTRIRDEEARKALEEHGERLVALVSRKVG